MKMATLAGEIKVFDPPDPFARVPEIAARLGVQPVSKDEAASRSYLLGMKDGTMFDFFELVAAFLDRMDEVHVEFGPRK